MWGILDQENRDRATPSPDSYPAKARGRRPPAAFDDSTGPSSSGVFPIIQSKQYTRGGLQFVTRSTNRAGQTRTDKARGRVNLGEPIVGFVPRHRWSRCRVKY